MVIDILLMFLHLSMVGWGTCLVVSATKGLSRWWWVWLRAGLRVAWRIVRGVEIGGRVSTRVVGWGRVVLVEVRGTATVVHRLVVSIRLVTISANHHKAPVMIHLLLWAYMILPRQKLCKSASLNTCTSQTLSTEGLTHLWSINYFVQHYLHWRR